MSSVGRGGQAPAVEAFFGDLVDEVALRAPVTRTRLVGGLAAVDGAVDPTVGTPVASEPVHVRAVPVEDWNRITDRAALRPAVALATREVHRRMASAVVAQGVGTRAGHDPFVVMDD